MVVIFIKTAGTPITLDVDAGDVLDMSALNDIGLPSDGILNKHTKGQLADILGNGLGIYTGIGRPKDTIISGIKNTWHRLSAYNQRNTSSASAASSSQAMPPPSEADEPEAETVNTLAFHVSDPIIHSWI